MKSCGWEERRLAFLYGEEAEDFSVHLEGCEECRAFVAEARDVLEAYRRTGGQALPSEVADRIVGSLRPVARQSVLRWASVAAATVVTAIMLSPLFIREGGEVRDGAGTSAAIGGTQVAQELRELKESVESLSIQPAASAIPAEGVEQLMTAAKEEVDRLVFERQERSIDGELEKVRECLDFMEAMVN